MIKLKLPRQQVVSPPPSELDLETLAATPTAVVLLGRRDFLKALAVLAAAMAAPIIRVERAIAASRGRFFTRAERHALDALCDRVIPPDQDPGGKALGAPAYIERMLTAFDHKVPPIFAGGPFSNRNPFPDERDGTPSRKKPKNDFRHFVPLSRIQDIRWRADILGSAKVPGASFNDAALGPLRGLREVYREGLAKLDEMATKLKGGAFARLSTTDQDAVLKAVDTPTFLRDTRRGRTFIDLTVQHTLEGCFSAPEYGGNHRLRGWRMLGLEGDDQPLGYSIFSTATNDYKERADHPMSTRNPDEVGGAKPLTADGERIQLLITQLTTGLEDC